MKIKLCVFGSIIFSSLFFLEGCSMPKKPLSSYNKKRNFQKTFEPKGVIKKSKNSPIFVIQKHAASRLHFDIRLEIGGVLVSWAVPKGPSLNPLDKRLAIHTEDHPYDYAKFEGIIPQGQYGGGTVMVWDYGTYENIKERDGEIVPMKQCLKEGRIEVFLYGKKLQGGFALVKIKTGWLLIKMRDEFASNKKIISSHDVSAKTGRTMKQIADEKDAIWE